MSNSKIEPSSPGARGEPRCQRVIGAAERLLRDGKTDFSMRDLATETGVSFATPFNQFGSKAAIMQTLSDHRIATMEIQFVATPARTNAAERVLLAMDTAVAAILEEPEVTRAVMGWLGTASSSAEQVWARSTELWTLALGAGDGLVAARKNLALRCLPGQLALAFRGVLSFWSAGALLDEALAPNARELASTLLLGFTERQLPRNLGS